MTRKFTIKCPYAGHAEVTVTVANDGTQRRVAFAEAKKELRKRIQTVTEDDWDFSKAEVVRVQKTGDWVCPKCGSTTMPWYEELEVRISVVDEITEKTINLGDVEDYADPDIDGPHHWLECKDCNYKMPATGWNVEVM